MIRIDDYPIDIAVNERYSFESEATEFPVERGADISDHIRLNGLVITIECVVSDTPIGPVASEPSRLAESDEGTELLPPGRDAFEYLVRLRNARKPVTYEGRRGRFENMVLSFEVADDVETTGGLRFTATLEQIQIVENRRITIKRVVKVPRGRPKINKGAVAGLDKIGGQKSVLVFTIRPGQKIDPTAWWANDPNKTLILASPKGKHYRAEQGALADGYVDATGYHAFTTPIPTPIDVVPVTSTGTPIPQTSDYVNPLTRRIGPDPSKAWNDAFSPSAAGGSFGDALSGVKPR